jgi:NADH-quinone oxidoreductase subunit C
MTEAALTIEEALELATDLLDGVFVEIHYEDDRLMIEVEPDDLLEAATRLHDDARLSFKYLSHVSGVDNLDSMATVCLLRSMDHPLLVEITVRLDREAPVVPTLTGIWDGANWHEREAYDLYGIIFEGHPDLRRLLNREDLDVFPCRKDARPHRKTRPQWRWEGLRPPRRLPGEPPRRERS